MKKIPFTHFFILPILFIYPFASILSQVDLQQPFKDCNIEGSITIYDYKNKKWTYSDEADAKVATLPASTFKILNSMIALETGVIKNENVVFKWDGQKRFVESWNADTDLKNAFKNSTVWYYVELAKMIGKKKYKRYLKKSQYGNGNLTEKGDDFWNIGNFAVSPINQIWMLIKLHDEQLPFSKRTFDIVKNIMIVEKNENYTLRAKTGWTTYGNNNIGWYIGYVERNDNVWFFATRLHKKVLTADDNFQSCRKIITNKILKEMKIIE